MLIGIIVLAAGLVFMGQGLGYIRWPASSFMISEIKWAYYGGGIALVGILLIIIAQGRRTGQEDNLPPTLIDGANIERALHPSVKPPSSNPWPPGMRLSCLL